MEFNIYDRVKVKEFVKIPEEVRNNRLGVLSGNEGEVVDKLWSDSLSKYVYVIHFDGKAKPSHKLFTEEMLEAIIAEPAEYTYEFKVLGNVVLAIFYEEVGSIKSEVARGHGHILHEGALGIAQASSYAMKKIYEKMNGGNL